MNKPNQQVQTYKPKLDMQSILPLMEEAKLQSSNLSYERLESMLFKYHEYPAKYRKLIWRFILRLPLNKEAFQNIMNKGIHPAFEDLKDKYPIKPLSLFNRLIRILSGIAFWSPVFAQVSYLPQLMFPFAKVIEYDDNVLFEIVLSLLLQWCSGWFVSYPLPPAEYLKLISDLITNVDLPLQEMLESKGFRMIDTVWPMLSNFFTNVLNEKDWLCMMDYLITFYHRPMLLPCLCVSYLKYFKPTISKLKDHNELSIFIHQFNALCMNKVMEIALKMLPTAEKLCEYKADRIPLCKDQYPVFTEYRPSMIHSGEALKDMIATKAEEDCRVQAEHNDAQTKKRELAKKILLLLNQSEAQ